MYQPKTHAQANLPTDWDGWAVAVIGLLGATAHVLAHE